MRSRDFDRSSSVPACQNDGDWDSVPESVWQHTQLLFVCSPGNPTGAVFSPDVLEAVAGVAQRHGLTIVSDEMYEHLVYGAEQVSVGRYAPEHTLTVNGASKAYAMTGWRIGYAGGPRAVIAAMNALQSQSTSNASSVGQ